MGAQALQAHMQEIASRVEQLETAFAEAAELFRDAAQAHFDSGGSGGWPPWAPSTARRASHQLMIDEGDLIGSLTDQGHAGHLMKIDGSTLTIGTRWPVASIHKSTSGRKLPQRDPMPPIEQLRQPWLELLNAHLLGTSGTSVRLGL